jgi:hypothetical protein
MSLIAFAEALQHTAPGVALRGAPPAAVLAIQIAHVLGLILLLTSLLLVNLRLLGWGLHALPLERVVQATRKALWLGLALTMGSGALLFLSAPVHYAANAAFVPKMVLLLTALAVQALLHQRANRGAAVLSLSLWFGVGLAGRAIGFV